LTDFLNGFFLGNAVKVWLRSAALTVVLFAAMLTVKRFWCSRLGRAVDREVGKAARLLLTIVRRTSVLFLAAVSVYVGSLLLRVPHPTRVVLEKLGLLAFLLQAGSWAAAGLSFWFGERIKAREKEDASSAATMKLLNYLVRTAIWALVLLLALDNLGVHVTTLIAGLGIGGIAVGLAVQNILSDLLAFISITLDKPFVPGDFIVVDEFMGTVEHIGIKTTRVRSLFGEQLVFGNNDLLKSRIRNYERMTERRSVITLGVAFETPPEKLEVIPGLVREVIEKTSGVRFDRAHFKEIGPSSLVFEVVYWVLSPDYKTYMDVQQTINLDIFRLFKEEAISFAYPAQRVLLERRN
jgi:small-conductance mechanosensitive channel